MLDGRKLELREVSLVQGRVTQIRQARVVARAEVIILIRATQRALILVNLAVNLQSLALLKVKNLKNQVAINHLPTPCLSDLLSQVMGTVVHQEVENQLDQ